jgi:hypothetical protein
MLERMTQADSSAIAQADAAPIPTPQAASVTDSGGAPEPALTSAVVAQAPSAANAAAIAQHKVTSWRTRLKLRIQAIENHSIAV